MVSKEDMMADLTKHINDLELDTEYPIEDYFEYLLSETIILLYNGDYRWNPIYSKGELTARLRWAETHLFGFLYDMGGLKQRYGENVLFKWFKRHFDDNGNYIDYERVNHIYG